MNLYQQIRYRTIDKCLQRKGVQWTWEKLVESCREAIFEVSGKEKTPSRRTIFYDIDRMKSGKLGYEAPIVFDSKTQSYKYKDPDFSITRVPLKRKDLNILQEILQVLRQFSGFQSMLGIENIITKLEYVLNIRSKPAKEVIHFDHAIYESGQQWLDVLYKCIQNEYCLQLSYHPFTVEVPYKKIISPYLLKEFNNRWFLIAYDHEIHKSQNFALDRIQAIDRYLLEKYYMAPQFDSNKYFNHIYGVSIPVNSQIQEIVFETTPEQAKYIRTKPVHPSQKILLSDDQTTTFSLKLIPNYELESLFLSFGEKVQLVKPKELRMKIKTRLKKAAEKYSE